MPLSTAKAVALSRDLADKLSKRFAGSATINTVRQAFDANGWPMLFLSSGGVETAGSAVILIRITGVDMVSKDIFGNSTTAYAPHTLEFNYELAAADNPIPTDGDLWTAAFEAIKVGCRTKFEENANGTAVTEANLATATVVADLEELYWPTKSV
jgi:hypothetical protein